MNALIQETLKIHYKFVENYLGNITNVPTKQLAIAYLAEMGELVNSDTTWKWWSKPEIDNDNILIELADSFLFILNIVYILDKKYNVSRNEIAQVIQENISKLQKNKVKSIAIVDLITYNTNSISHFDFDNWKNEISGLTYNHFLIGIHYGHKPENILKLVLAKNVLNIFRQEHGYKTGQYEKLWNGIEDNVYLFEYAKNNENITYENTYKFLELAYKLKSFIEVFGKSI